MRPEYRSTRSARSIPTQHSISRSKNDKIQPARTVSLPPTIPLDSLDTLHLTKMKEPRRRMTDEQLTNLEALYNRDTHPTTKEKEALGRRVKLEVKSVSVWFQNKRQTERKARRLSSSTEALSDSVTEFSALKCVSSPSKNNTLGKRPRSHCNPISHQHHVGTQENLLSVTNHDITREVGHTKIHISTPLSTISSRNNMAVASHELWKHILSSSPSASDDSLRASSDFGSVERLANSAADIHIGEIGFPVDSDEKRSRILEWACNREMKRKRGGRHGSAKTSALRLNQGLGFDEGHCCASPYCCRPEFESALSLLSLPGSSALIASPSEDVIHAASLLLCLKHSIRRPKSFDRAEFNN